LSFGGGSVSAKVLQELTNNQKNRSEYEFLILENGTPATWPCDAVITIQVNLDQVQPRMLRSSLLHDLQGAASAINKHARVKFVVNGSTSMIPNLPLRDIAKTYPNTVLFAFVFQGQSELLPSNAAAAGGSYWIHDSQLDRPVMRLGYVLVDINRLEDYRSDSGYLSRQAMFTHELLHVLGLDHVKDRRSILNERMSTSAGSIGPGDINGIKALGALACGI